MKQIIFFVLAIVGCGCIAQATQSSASPQPAFSIALSTPARSISASSPIEIRITAQNISGKDIPWEADFGDTAYKAFHFLLTKDGHEVETTFFHRKITGRNRPGDPLEVSGGSSFLGTLPAGKSLVETVDLKRLYQITEPGLYTLEVSRFDNRSATMIRSKLLTLKIVP